MEKPRLNSAVVVGPPSGEGQRGPAGSPPSASGRSNTPPGRASTPPLPRDRASAEVAVSDATDRRHSVAIAERTAPVHPGPLTDPASQEQDGLLSGGTPEPSAPNKVGVEQHYLIRAMKLFDELDEDHSGTLDKAELSRLADRLGHHWSQLERTNNFERLLSMELDHQRSVYASNGVTTGSVSDISAAVSRKRLRVATAAMTKRRYRAPWYVFVPRKSILQLVDAKQMLSKDYADMALGDLKGQAKIWGVDAEKLDAEKVNTNTAVIDLMTKNFATKQLFDISFLRSFAKQRCPADRLHYEQENDSVPLTSTETETIWARYQSGSDSNNHHTAVISQPVFCQWWRGYRRRLHREMLSWAHKCFTKHTSHIITIPATAGHRDSETSTDSQTIRVMSQGEFNILAQRITKRFEWLEKEIGKLDFEQARMDSSPCIQRGRDEGLTFEEFSSYLRKRMGSDDPKSPLLPESIVLQIDENVEGSSFVDRVAHQTAHSTSDRQQLKSSKDKLQAARAAHAQRETDEETGGRPTASETMQKPRTELGQALWQFLRPRLHMLAHFEAVWGDLHELYPQNAESRHIEEFVPRFIRHPDSNFSVAWDVIQVFALMYVAVLVPLRLCFDYEPQPPGFQNGLGQFEWWTDLVVDLYFMTDIFVQFRTAYRDSATGVLEVGRGRISRRYLRGWFLIDFPSVLPFSYINLIVLPAAAQPTGNLPLASSFGRLDGTNGKDQLSGTAGNIKILKMFRFLRIAKLLRLTKFKSMWERHEDQLDMSQYMHMAATLAAITCVAHFVSCLWYLVGTMDDEEVDGWVTNSHTGLQWETRKTNLPILYSTAMYSIFSGQWAFTGHERLFSIFAELVVGLIYGALAGVMSSIMMTSKIADQEKALKFASVRAWMRARGLARTTQAKIMKHYTSKYKSRSVFDEEEILEELPTVLSDRVALTLYNNHIIKIPFFRGLGEHTRTMICRLVNTINVPKDGEVFNEGDSSTEMYIVIEGAFFGETALIEAVSGNANETWRRTRTTRATIDTVLGEISAEKLRDVWETFPGLKLKMLQFLMIGRKTAGKKPHKNSKRMKTAHAWAHAIKLHSDASLETRQDEMEGTLKKQGEQLEKLQSSVDELLSMMRGLTAQSSLPAS